MVTWYGSASSWLHGMVEHHRGSVCHAKRILCGLQGQFHREGSYNQNMTASTISSDIPRSFVYIGR